jgi:hypothetical protein
MSGTSTLTQFQRFVWESLPIRREAVGREVIDDVVLMAVQCWPVEELPQADGNTQQEVIVLRALGNDIRRIMALVYGQDRFHGYWLVALRVLIPQVVDLIHDWWRRRKDNRAKMIMWRRKWVVE